MNVDEAILAHARWKTRLIGYLAKPDGSISVGDLEADNKCELGKWIHGEAKSAAPAAELAALQAAHASFHRSAAIVVRKIDGGARNTDQLVGRESEFGAASLKVVTLLKALMQKIR
jgi:hypothetical protein